MEKYLPKIKCSKCGLAIKIWIRSRSIILVKLKSKVTSFVNLSRGDLIQLKVWCSLNSKKEKYRIEFY